MLLEWVDYYSLLFLAPFLALEFFWRARRYDAPRGWRWRTVAVWLVGFGVSLAGGRAWGTVHRRDLKGPVLINYWSWNNNHSWLAMLNPITWIQLLLGEMRWDRIGMTFSCETGAALAGSPDETR